MNNAIKIIVLLALAVIVVIVVTDHLSNRPDKRPDNPFAYDLQDYKLTDEDLVHYRETRQIAISQGQPKAIAYKHGRIYLLVDAALQLITPDGQEIMTTQTDEDPLCLAVLNDSSVIVGYKNYLVLYDSGGKEAFRSALAQNHSKFTALACAGDYIFAADAGTRQVLVYNTELEQIDAFKGESGVSDIHGFILPSAHFDLAANDDQELWVVNPGLHRLQNYTAEGRLRGHWGKSSFGPEGFSGCCNPYYIAFLSDGKFVTSEKGLIRVKVYKPSGEFISMVAPPERFTGGSRAPAIAVSDEDAILLLDFDKSMIRFFLQK
jgi:hypothetical protein